ncbi:hypothetical protein DFS34DRAFT_28852 [Phlyctochytrium arcticum]|nr:hypothetical protein DFS34DRAFT_28852 [Phlyctochytrium arcticum]
MPSDGKDSDDTVALTPNYRAPGSSESESTNVAGTGVGRFRSDPLGFMLRLTSESTAFYSGEGWRAYQNYIGSKIFYPEYSSEIRNALMTAPRLQTAVMRVSLERLRLLHAASPPKDKLVKRNKKARDVTLAEVEADTYKQLVKMMQGMVADMNSMRTVRVIAFVLNNILVRMYHQGIHIRENEFVQLRKYAQYAEKNKLSLILMPSHKSHVDYLVVSYLFYRLGMALPHIAAGDNLNMPGIGWFLKHGGAFFIRRTWGNDVLYNELMREYIELLLNRGHNIEVFIEGTRSRMGKLLQPKFGILKIILDAIASGRVRDAIIVPMSIGYDKVIETESYVNELLGTPKQKESLTQLLGNANILQFKWGRIDVRFAKPYSLKDYIDSQLVRRGKSFDPLNKMQDKNLLLQSFGFSVLSDINAVSVTMPTALVGAVILTLRGRGVGRSEMVRKVNWLKREILQKGGRVAHFGTTPTTEIVERAVLQMKDLIGQRTDLLEPVYYPLKRFEISLYRNQVIHLFLNEAILSTAMYATVKAGGPVHAQRILIPELAEDVAFVSQLLKSEFIYGQGGLERNLKETIARLHDANVVSIEDEVLPGAEGSEKVVRRWIALSAEERRIGRETFDFYCFLLWPFIETYWLAAVSLFSILPKVPIVPGKPPTLEWVDERVFMTRAQLFGRTLYYEGDLSYFESINKETIKNAILRLRDMGVVLIQKSVLPPPKTAPYQAKQPSQPTDLSAPPPPPPSGPVVTWIAIAPKYIPTELFPSPQPKAQPVRPDQAVAAEAAEAITSAFAALDAAGSAAGAAYRTEKASRASKKEKAEFDRKHPVPRATSSALDGPLPASLPNNSINPAMLPPSAVLLPILPPLPTDAEDAEYEAWRNMQHKSLLWEFCEQIGKFRREGKNRRDTATVGIRVLRLARIAAVWVDSRRGKGKASPANGSASSNGSSEFTATGSSQNPEGAGGRPRL